MIELLKVNNKKCKQTLVGTYLGIKKDIWNTFWLLQTISQRYNASLFFLETHHNLGATIRDRN